ncbi:tryptophanyl-tRNA synthetase [Jezberella montanilacus]|uniref:Tryptophan--tRNA ligase n=2 Tax=Jezberella montanilacus TaxID=323426 RepID=A0A2T0XKF1_9BURK|nr:tryptophanyl-tRNA synthetase [Jezberella montanilacus]
MMNSRVLTGITTSGTPHLGNYVGAIRPAITASQSPTVDAFFFLADYHALIKCEDPERIARSRLEIAATWLACGLDPSRVTFYCQSDIPEIPELSWMLTCVTAKGMMNRAHAYKASVDQNHAKGVDEDDGVTMGLFSYPVLMAADILMFNAHHVPVGRDQIQHIEMTRDIAQRFNHLFGAGKEFFVLPEAVIAEEVATLPGLDGRKMSKSYNNTIPLFEGGPKALKAAVARIVTDSLGPGEPKDADASHLYLIYKAFARSEESKAFHADLTAGIGWGDAKQRLCDRIEAELAPMREKYEALMQNPEQIEETLAVGAQKARQIATPFMQTLRQSVGIRKLAGSANKAPVQGGSANKGGKTARYVSFRDEAGQFRFRFLAADGQELFCSIAYADPKQAGAVRKQLEQGHAGDFISLQGETGFILSLDGQTVATGTVTASATERDALLHALQSAMVPAATD